MSEPPTDKCNHKLPNGGLCARKAGWGTEREGIGRCKSHTGSETSQTMVRYEIEKNIAIQDNARTEADTRRLGMGRPIPFIDPVKALLDSIYRGAGHVQWLEDQIALWEVDTEQEPTMAQAEWLKIYRTERDMLAKHAKMAIDAGIAERRVKLAEEEGKLLVEGINLILEELDLTRAQRDMIPRIVPKVLAGLAQPYLEANGMIIDQLER